MAGPLVGIFFGTSAVTDYEGARASASTGLYPALMHGLLERGVAIAPGAYEVLFPSLAHTDADLERTVEAFWEPPGRLGALAWSSSVGGFGPGQGGEGLVGRLGRPDLVGP